MKMSDKLFEPEMVLDVAKRLHGDGVIVAESHDEGFVLQHSFNSKGCTFVGLREADDQFVVAKMWKKSETIGRSDPKIQTRKNEYVQCELYRMALDTPIENTDEQVETIADRIDSSEYDEKIDTGYVNGYRLTPLKRVLEDVFRWYGEW